MAISTRQFNKVYSYYLSKFLKDGSIPSYGDVVKLAGDELPSVGVAHVPVYKYRPQARDEVFDISLYNKAMRQIGMDLEILTEETSEISDINITKILDANLFQRVQGHQLKNLENSLDAILFSLDGGSENFFGQYDNFSDMSKINLDKSTRDIINSSEGTLSLPIGLKGSFKLDLSHLFQLTTPADLTISDSSATNLGSIPGTLFGNCVSDAVNGWGVTVSSNEDKPIDISFSFRLKREEFVNRITLAHYGDFPQKAVVATSVDNVNIHNIKEYSDGILLEDQGKSVSLDFEDTLVDYVHITLSKSKADSFTERDDGSKEYRYVFGLRNISLFMTGREQKASYISKPFDFTEDLSAIGSIGITAKELIPDATNIEWYVSGVAEDGSMVGEYVPISPQNRTDSTGAPKIVSFQDTISKEKSITSTETSITLIETAQNIDFYNICNIDSEPVFGTAQLFRGFKSWLRDKKQAVDPTQVKDNFVSFSKGDIQSLYVVVTEVLTPQVVSVEGNNMNVVFPSKAPLYNPSKGHFLVPDKDVNPEKDTAPIYAIYRASLSVENSTIVQSPITFENGIDGKDENNNVISKTIDLQSKIILYNNQGDIKIEKADGSGQKLYVDGIDYIVKLDEEGFPTGEIVGISTDFLSQTYENPAGSGQFEWQPVKVTFTINTDVTKHVQEISGNQVFFDLPVGSIPPNSAVVLKYRHIADNVLKASVKAKALFGAAGESTIYVQGNDYIFDSANGTIQRVSTGAINSTDDIYVDFKYNDIGASLEQFFIWANVKDGSGISIERAADSGFSTKNSLNVNTELGEELLASIPGVGLVNLTLATEWPEMEGWVQFVVKSANPENIPEALINQVIKLKDAFGNFIFKLNGKYFNELIANRDPLEQVSYPVLKTNVLKNDRRYFAVREVIVGGYYQYQVVVNFKPNETGDFYSFTAEENQNSTGEVGLKAVQEEWKIKWTNKEATGNAFTRVVVRADLSRNLEDSSNITPKVDQYFIKVSY